MDAATEKALLAEVVRIRRALEALAHHLGAGGTPASSQGKSGGKGVVAMDPGSVAPDEDLDGRFGNPAVRFDPRNWSGPSMKGKTMSECTGDFLEVYAEACDYFAKQETDETKRGYKLNDAARARGWAKRRQAHPPAPTPDEFG